MPLKIGLIQMRCEKAAFEENLERFSHYLNEATSRNIDIVGFPEMSISGYADPTRQHEAILRLDGPEIARILETTRNHSATVLAGLIEENPGQKPFITQIAVRPALLGVGPNSKPETVPEDLNKNAALPPNKNTPSAYNPAPRTTVQNLLPEHQNKPRPDGTIAGPV